MDTDLFRCPKCFFATGDDWKQCGGSCPMKDSPHYKEERVTYDQNQRTEIIAIALHYINQGLANEAGYPLETWEESCEHDKVQCRNEARDTFDPVSNMLQYSLNKRLDGNPPEHS